jgi:hypothetical protein
MHPEHSPECGQNISPGGKQISLTLFFKAKETPTLVLTGVVVYKTFEAYSKLLDVRRKVTLLRSLCKAVSSHLKKKNPHRRTNMGLRGD